MLTKYSWGRSCRVLYACFCLLTQTLLPQSSPRPNAVAMTAIVARTRLLRPTISTILPARPSDGHFGDYGSHSVWLASSILA